MFSLESLAALATIIGSVASVAALFQSRSWLALTGVPIVALALVAGFYARRGNQSLKSAAISIEGHSIDVLNITNLRRRLNRTLFVQEAHHTAHIVGEDLKIEWKYAGYCRAKDESAVEFSIGSQHGQSFEQLDCLAYDLEHDAALKHAIRPVLVGTDGLSKNIAVPLLEPLKANEPFRVLLKCTLPACMKAGFSYYMYTPSFAQNQIQHCSVRLKFAKSKPQWVRVYDCASASEPKLLKTLTISRREQGIYEYLDEFSDAPGRAARIYAFWRDSF